MTQNSIIKRHTSFHIRQQDQSDCGVACMAMILKSLGGNGNLESLRELSGTSRTGTTLLGLYQACPQLGLKAGAYEATLEQLKETSHPAILHVLIDNRLLHYVVCWGWDERQKAFLIADPAHDTTWMTGEKLDAIWQSKALLLIEGTEENFVAQNSRNKEKRNWIWQLIEADINILVVALFLGLILSVLGLTMSVFSQRLLDEILPSGDPFRLFAGIGILAFLLLAKAMLGYVRQTFLIRQSRDFNIRIINKFYGALLFLPKAFFDNRKTGDLIARMNDTSRIQGTLSHLAANVMIDVLMILVAAIAIMTYSWYLGLLSLTALPIYLGLTWRFHQPIVNGQKQVMSSHAQNESHYVDSIQGIGDIKVYNKESQFTELTKKVYAHFQERIFDLGKVQIHFSLLAELAGTLLLVAILLWSGALVLNDTLTAGALIAILQLTGMLMSSTGQLAMTYIQVQEAKVAFDRMYEFASMEGEQEDGSVEGATIQFNSLKVEQVSFRFPGRPRLLEDISLEVEKGECVALLGESGSGKSTLLQILQGFYTPEEGEILINGYPLSDYTLSDYRKTLGVVSQDIKIFNGTVLDNILLGEIPEDSTDLVQLPGLLKLQAYGFEPFFEQLPQGLATIVGEEGINLSGGQKQMLALARALYRQPQLLLLDEPTAAMDRKLRNFVMDLIDSLKKEMAILLLTHELGTTRRADRMYILEDKRIGIWGSHHELIAQGNNLYASSWKDLLPEGSEVFPL